VLELVYTAWDIKAFADDVWREADEGLRARLRAGWEANRAATGGHRWEPPEGMAPAPDGIPLPPFVWDEERRAQLRAQLDAIYFHLYGIERGDVDYIMSTFPIVERKDRAAYGTYRTRDLILAYYDAYASGTPDALRTWLGGPSPGPSPFRGGE